MTILLTKIDYLVLLLYIVALFIFGFYLNRRSTASTDIFLGGRSLKWWQIGFSMFSANAGATMLIGLSSLGFSHGVVGSNFEWLAWIFLLLLAMFFFPRYIAAGIHTIPQFLLIRYGKRSYNFLVIYSLVSILIVWLASALYAGGLVIAQVFHRPLLESISVIALIAASYTAIGGLKAVVRTGIFQSVIIIISSVILTILALKKVTAIPGWAQDTPVDYWKLFHPRSDPEYSWLAIVMGYPVVAIYYWCADQTIVQKVLAAKDIRHGQYGIMLIAAMKIITPLIFVLPGIICFILFRDTTTPDNAYITMVEKLMPAGLRGLCIAALIAALIDTVSSGLNSFSTVFTLDVVGQFTTLEEPAKRSIGKWVTVLAAFLGVGVAALFARSGKGLFELSQGLVSILAPPLSVVFLGGIFWKRVNKLAAEVVLYGGGLICVVIGSCYVLNFPYKGYWPHFLLLSVYIFIALSFGMVLITLLSDPNKNTVSPTVWTSSQPLFRNSSRVWMGWGLLALVMIIIYIVFK